MRSITVNSVGFRMSLAVVIEKMWNSFLAEGARRCPSPLTGYEKYHKWFRDSLKRVDRVSFAADTIGAVPLSSPLSSPIFSSVFFTPSSIMRMTNRALYLLYYRRVDRRTLHFWKSRDNQYTARARYRYRAIAVQTRKHAPLRDCVRARAHVIFILHVPSNAP